MKVSVVCEWRFVQTPDGTCWTSNAFDNSFWTRYLQVFEHVEIIARVANVDSVPVDFKQVTGDRIALSGLPSYVGFMGLIKRAFAIRNKLKISLCNTDAVIFRVPSQTAMIAQWGMLRLKTPYALEIVGDPYDVFRSGISNQILDKFLGWFSTISLKKLARNATACCYVTEAYLQKRYPTLSKVAVSCSDIDLNTDDYSRAPKVLSQQPSRIAFVGSFEQMYKGPDILLKAISELCKEGLFFQVWMVGGGRYLEEMKELACTLGVSQYIRFTGNVPSNVVKKTLNSADIFVMPSRTEGLPRALLEAMAVGLPCLASDVGGIPELISSKWIFQRESIRELANLLRDAKNDIAALNQAADENHKRSHDFEKTALSEMRQNFYRAFGRKVVDAQQK